MASRIEQETTVTAIRAEGLVYIYTANPVHLRRLRKDDRATEVAGGDDWGRFTLPASAFDPLKGFKRKGRVMTEDEKAAAGERLAAARAAR
jgi:hypothetical protein